MKDTIARLRKGGWECECSEGVRCLPCALILAADRIDYLEAEADWKMEMAAQAVDNQNAEAAYEELMREKAETAQMEADMRAECPPGKESA